MSHLFPTYARWEVEPESAFGTKIIDKSGKEYLDFSSGIGVCNLGHRPKKVEEAVLEQIIKLWHVSNLFESGNQEKAAQMLATAAGMERVFFANSGAEANEAAIKLARKATGKTKIITFHNSFHGRTFAAMSATGQDKIKLGFGPMLETFINVSYNDIESLKNQMGDDVAAVMIEIIQGEGGIHVGNQKFLQGVQELCKQYGTLLVIDEIQTGIGRTGKPFAFQHFDLDPDIVTSAKGLGSGFPIGAVIGKEALVKHFGPGSHGSTFGGNPVSIAAAIATMNSIFTEELLTEVAEKSNLLLNQLQNKLAGISIIKEIRGLGLMIGIECTLPVTDLISKLRAKGLIVLPAGEKVIRLLPPLNISQEDLDKGIQFFTEVVIELDTKTTVKA